MYGKIAVVTGANRGIGFEIAKELAEKGFQVILTARDAKKGVLAAKQLAITGLPVEFMQLDVSTDKSISKFAKMFSKKFDHLDVLVNNAGILLDEGNTTLDVPREVIKKTLETNLYGPFLLSQAMLPWLLRSEDCRIINISSGLGSLSDAVPGYPAYSISKTALNGLTVKMAADLKDRGIKVNAVSPGWVKTRMGGDEAPRSVEEGADTAVWLATHKDLPTGKFFKDRKEINW